ETDLSKINSFTCYAKRLSESFISCQFEFITRNGNQTAHAMELERMLRQGEAFSVEDTPSLVLNHATTDCQYIDPP
ncbi:hypothetical protein J1N35_011616, partial [Gossypium stocksii]